MNRRPFKTALLMTALFLTASIGASAETVLKSGSWTKKGYSMSGTWKIVKDGDTTKLALRGLKTKSGADLKLFLSPTALGTVRGKTATKGSLELASLKSAKGDQEYVIPSSVKLTDYKSLLLHCEKFSKLWGGASL